jgi:hypothetical protein
MTMLSDEFTARIHFTQLGRIWIDLGAISCVLVAVLFACGSVYGLLVVSSGGQWALFLVTSCLAVYMACLARLHLKYRYILWLDYVVGSRGIVVEETERKYFVSWGDVEVAEYLPVVGVFRLFVKNQRQPIVLFMLDVARTKDNTARHRKMAEQYIRSGLSEKLQQRWIPW